MVEIDARSALPDVREFVSRLYAPTLYVNVNVIEIEAGGGAYVFAVEVELQEFVYTERQLRALPDQTTSVIMLSVEQESYSATTWDSGSNGLAVRSEARTFIRDQVLQHVDRFANDYLAANPR